MITRRRALVAAGAGVLLGGCGAPDEPPPDATLLRESAGAERDLADAYQRLGGELGDALSARARRNAERLQGLLGGKDGAPTRLSAQPVGGDPERRALDATRRAMRVHVRAVGLLRTSAHRVAVADVLTDDAQHDAVLSARFGGDALASAFPDGREA